MITSDIGNDQDNTVTIHHFLHVLHHPQSGRYQGSHRLTLAVAASWKAFQILFAAHAPHTVAICSAITLEQFQELIWSWWQVLKHWCN